MGRLVEVIVLAVLTGACYWFFVDSSLQLSATYGAHGSVRFDSLWDNPMIKRPWLSTQFLRNQPIFTSAFIPEAFHPPEQTKRPYFEGWYNKIVSADGQNAVAIITGIFFGLNPSQEAENRNEELRQKDSPPTYSQDHTFVMSVLQIQGEPTRVAMHIFSPQEFRALNNRGLDHSIALNRFSETGLTLDLSAYPNYTNFAPEPIKGSFRYKNIKPWPITVMSPGIMGLFEYLPFLECYHGVASLHHQVEGSIKIGNRIVDFNGGIGYIEKDRGFNFPHSWVWFQTNHFQPRKHSLPGQWNNKIPVSLTVSIAHIPFVLGASFRGFLIGFLLNDTLYRFTTTTNSRITRLNLYRGSVKPYLSLVVEDFHHRLTIRIDGDSHSNIRAGNITEKEILLYAPRQGAMRQWVRESLTGVVDVKLEAKTGNTTLLFDGHGVHCGMEVMGELSLIATLLENPLQEDLF